MKEKMKEKMPSYKEAVKEIESILSKIENGEPDVDELAVLAKRAGSLVRLCREKLQTTEEEIKKVLDEDDKNKELS